MAIPLLASLMGLTAFLGWAMMNQQNVKSSARYTAWRRVYGHGPRDDGTWDPNGGARWSNHPTINTMFYREKAVSIGAGGDSGPTDEFEQLVAAAFQYSEYAGNYADRMILNPLPEHSHFQHARRAHMSGDFRSDLDVLNTYRGAIHAHHIRDGVEWRRNQATCRHVVREQFLGSLDSVLESVRSPGDSMAEMVRSLYRNGW